MVVNSYQVNELVIEADLFPFEFQKFLLKMLNFLLGIFILPFPSYSQYLECFLSVQPLFLFSLSSQLYNGMSKNQTIKTKPPNYSLC